MGKLNILKSIKLDKNFPRAKFQFSSIPFVKVITIELFFSWLKLLTQALN